MPYSTTRIGRFRVYGVDMVLYIFDQDVFILRCWENNQNASVYVNGSSLNVDCTHFRGCLKISWRFTILIWKEIPRLAEWRSLFWNIWRPEGVETVFGLRMKLDHGKTGEWSKQLPYSAAASLDLAPSLLLLHHRLVPPPPAGLAGVMRSGKPDLWVRFW
jgi:hypothetical protein